MHRDIKNEIIIREAAKMAKSATHSRRVARDREMRNCQDEIDRAVRWAMAGSPGVPFSTVRASHDTELVISLRFPFLPNIIYSLP